MHPKSVLIIGSTGRLGSNFIEQLDKSKADPDIFAFCRNANKLAKKMRKICAGTIEGDARNSTDLERALGESGADLVIVSIGNGDNVKATDIPSASANALVQALRKPKFSQVQVLVISIIGAGGTKIITGFGIGILVAYHLRHVLKDHDGQEAAFLASIKDRTMIVRPTGLTENESTGKLVLFDGDKKCPTMKTDRKDLAEWIVNEALYGTSNLFGSKPINITCI